MGLGGDEIKPMEHVRKASRTSGFGLVMAGKHLGVRKSKERSYRNASICKICRFGVSRKRNLVRSCVICLNRCNLAVVVCSYVDTFTITEFF